MLIQHIHPALQGHVTQNGTYQVCPANAPVSLWVNSFWELTVDPGEYIYRSVPDNCVDLIFNLDDQSEGFVITPFLEPLECAIIGPASYFGIRFGALASQGLIETPLGEWLDPGSHVDTRGLLHPLLIEQIRVTLHQSTDFSMRSERISSLLLAHLKHPQIDARLLRFIRSVFNPNPFDCGVSARQLRRISHLHLGVSPKDFLRVARFQATLHHMNTCHNWPAWPQFYYDQSHFIREFKDFTGATPGRFMKMSVLYKKSINPSK
ncbi:helix-turn-helix domain-containing protein [Limnobacter sp. CACIAM 66H1]|uniref:helix-turn-helix domain-containing protein n=1 Tax=Limnobacter sp. CACIAM 66H1 TaxID=1813033 RepID=UPI0025C2C2FB|nr:helix-turn-helix domain-containing protein [Limnobacter sp. CACIAM 66H1]